MDQWHFSTSRLFLWVWAKPRHHRENSRFLSFSVFRSAHLGDADPVHPLVQSPDVVAAKVLDVLRLLLDLRMLASKVGDFYLIFSSRKKQNTKGVLIVPRHDFFGLSPRQFNSLAQFLLFLYIHFEWHTADLRVRHLPSGPDSSPWGPCTCCGSPGRNTRWRGPAAGSRPGLGTPARQRGRETTHLWQLMFGAQHAVALQIHGL